MKIDWKRKLSSRKFWMALIVAVVAMITAFGGSKETVEQVKCLLIAVADVVIYILAETATDVAGIMANKPVESMLEEIENK